MSSKKIKAGVLKETKVPVDRRVAVTPETAFEINKRFPGVELVVQKSDIRAIPDHEYNKQGVKLVDEVSDCDILIGVKEVAPEELIEGKTYLMFAHVAKEQEYNRQFFKTMSQKNITLIDYEYLTDEGHNRLVAFGYWAGVVGAYNAIVAACEKFGSLKLPLPQELAGQKEMYRILKEINVPGNLRFLVTGGGRVAMGAMEVLSKTGIKEVSFTDYLSTRYEYPVICRIDPCQYLRHKSGKKFLFNHFCNHPWEYESVFLPYTRITDVYIPCHFWDQRSPVFFTKEEAQSEDFRISVIADVSCDLQIPIPSTLRSSTLDDPFYDYNRETGEEEPAFSRADNITVMAVDNLPGALPVDASGEFANVLIEKVFPSLFGADENGIIEKATILDSGKLGSHFDYLEDYLKG